MANEKVDIATGQAPQAFNPFFESNDGLNLGTTDLRISTFPTANMLGQPMLEASFLLNSTTITLEASVQFDSTTNIMEGLA